MDDLGRAADLLTPNVITRFESKFTRPAEGCWIWRGGLDDDGYGQFFVPDGTKHGINVRAHRLSYHYYVARFDPALHVDHLCRRPWCVRPDHLDPVTPFVNNRRGFGTAARNALKLECKRGHPFTAENTLVNNRGARVCRTCKRAQERKRDKKA